MRHAAPTLALVLLARVAAGQTNDHFFRSWRWEGGAVGARTAGLAGAVAALPDEAAAALQNPATIAGLARAELAGGALGRRPGRSAAGDTIAARTGLGIVTAALPVGRGAVAAYLAEPHGLESRLAAPALPDGLTDVGSLQGVVTEAGLAAGWRLTSRLHAGVRLAAARLTLDGEYSREAAEGQPASLRVSTTSGSTRLTGGFGVVLVPAARLRLAAAFTERVRWPSERRATSPALGVVLEEAGSFEVRRPRALSVGLWFQPSLKVALLGQVDRVSYGDLAKGVVIGQGAHSREDYALEDAWEARGGLEVSLPVGRSSLQLRGGIHRRAAGILAYVGSDPVEAAVFSGGRAATVAAAGASIVTPRWLRFDVAARFGGERATLLVGTGVRF